MAIPISRTTYVNDGGSKTTSTPYKDLMSAKSRLSQQAVDRIDKGVIQQPTKTLNPSGGTTAYTPRIVGSTTPQYLNNYTAKSKTENNQNYNNGSAGRATGVGVATAEETPVVSGGGGGTSGQDDTLEKIKSLLEEQKKQADSYYKTLYEQQLASNKSAWENNRNQINKNYVRTDRYLNNMYGDAVSGTGLSNRMRNYSNWNNNLTENQRNYTNNDASALASYNQGLSNNANTLAQGWYNYVLPVYTNRQQNTDDLDYRKYLMSLGLM